MTIVTKDNRCLPIAEWPEADRARWTVAQQPPHPLKPEVGYASSRWAASTQRLIERGYGHWLTWLTRANQLLATEGPGDRATLERVGRYLDTLRAAGLADFTIAGRLKQLGDALHAIASDRDWRWINRAAGRIHTSAARSRDLNPKIRPADEVLELGFRMMGVANESTFLPRVERAVLFRDGLAIAFLVLRPLRVSNLSAIALGKHLERHGDRWIVRFPAEEVKTKRPLEFTWPEACVEPLEVYLAEYRPALLAQSDGPPGEVRALWVSQRGGAMARGVMGQQICQRTELALGQAINPHAFRHIAATTIAMQQPDAMAQVAAVLGHTNIQSSDRFYNRAGTVPASRRFQETIRRKRQEKS